MKAINLFLRRKKSKNFILSILIIHFINIFLRVPTPLRSTPTRETLDQVKQLKQSVSETRTSLEEVRTKYDTVFGEYKTKSWFELVTTHINLRSRIEDLEEELRELRKARKKVINNNQE